MRPPSPVKPSRVSALFGAVVVIVLFCAALLLCDVSKSPESVEGERWPALIDRLLAAPVEMTDVSDLRAYATPVGLAALLAILALFGLPTGAWEKAAVEKVAGAGGWRGAAGRYWLEGLVILTLAAGATSAAVNGTWEISRGYLFTLATWLAWAVVIARFAAVARPGRVVVAASVVAVVASVLSLWHRLALGERFFQLPVGPVTVTAGLGTLWAGAAIGWLSGRLVSPRRGEIAARPGGAAVAWAGFVALCSLVLMAFAARRGAAIGLAAALSYVAGVIAWHRYPSRTMRGAVLGFFAVVLCAGVAFVVQQSLSIERVISVPLKLRYIYYETMAKMSMDAPLFGYGPDIFCCLMTTTLAPMRAETPLRLHGGVDFDAHNEWLQAIFEWGVPGGAAYIAIPVAAIALVAVAWPRVTDASARALLLGGGAGLVAVFVTELSSINLRYSIVAPWFWTLVGVTVGTLRRPGGSGAGPAVADSSADREMDRGDSARKGRRRLERANPASREEATAAAGIHALARIACIAGAAGILFVVVADFRAGLEHAKGRALMYRDDRAAVGHLRDALGRFGANRWLSTRSYLANSLTNIARVARQSPEAASQPAVATAAREAGEEALRWWRVIYERSPAYLDTGYKLAETQYLLGDTPGSRATLEEYLRDYKPYYKEAISFYLQIAELRPAEILDFVLRALRSDRWDNILLAKAREALSAPDVGAAWPGRVQTAREDIATREPTEWREPMAPEILRVEAFQELTGGNLAAAERTQLAAAEAYAGLAKRDSPLRRVSPAEVDAWYLAARFLFDLDAGRFEEAYRRIEKAERVAVQGLRYDRTIKGEPGDPWVGGHVMPLEAPERLRDVWRFSAQMHMTQKASPRQVSLRVTWSMPMALQRDAAAIQAELGRLAAELVQRYSALPEARRPASFGELVRLMHQYGGSAPQ